MLWDGFGEHERADLHWPDAMYDPVHAVSRKQSWILFFATILDADSRS
jgi:hypothetical protein